MSRFFAISFYKDISFTDDIRHECERLYKAAKRNLEKHGNLVPMAFIIKPNGAIDALPQQFNGNREKRAAYAAVVAMARSVKAIGVILINDVWRLSVNKDDKNFDELIAQHDRQGIANNPESKEVLHLILYGKFGAYTIASPYHRVGLQSKNQLIVWDKEESAFEEIKSEDYKTRLLSPWWDTDDERKPM